MSNLCQYINERTKFSESVTCNHIVLVRMKEFTEPGAVRHGNFMNYYDFNSAIDRLKLLPINSDFWNISAVITASADAYLVLDVGCNAGNFTQILFEFLRERIPERNIFILGIDIDPILIKRAKGANKHPENVFYECYNVMEYQNSDTNHIFNFLKNYNKLRFELVCCFSISMWIHLNNGDEGLNIFLDFMSSLSNILIIEPQPWKCYQNAVRRMRRAKAEDIFPLYATLKMRNNVENDIKNYLTSEKEMQFLFESDPTAWKRKICIYQKKTKANCL